MSKMNISAQTSAAFVASQDVADPHAHEFAIDTVFKGKEVSLYQVKIPEP